jgi:hypothetical protein
MPAYSGKAQPYLDAIAEGLFASQEIRDWLLVGTSMAEQYTGAKVLIDEQRAVRWRVKPTKQPFWANYWCGRDSRCTCRIEGSKGLESDAIFFLRNDLARVLAVHVEFKHTGEAFSYGQPEAYPLRAACFAKTYHERPTLNRHDHWMTVLFCGEETLIDQRLTYFQRVITHGEAARMIRAYPKSASIL